jgi:hypothetical protein
MSDIGNKSSTQTTASCQYCQRIADKIKDHQTYPAAHIVVANLYKHKNLPQPKPSVLLLKNCIPSKNDFQSFI